MLGDPFGGSEGIAFQVELGGPTSPLAREVGRAPLGKAGEAGIFSFDIEQRAWCSSGTAGVDREVEAGGVRVAVLFCPVESTSALMHRTQQ